MSNQPTSIMFFQTESSAEEYCRRKNCENAMSGWLFVIVDGPDDDPDANFAVVDIATATELGEYYRWVA